MIEKCVCVYLERVNVHCFTFKSVLLSILVDTLVCIHMFNKLNTEIFLSLFIPLKRRVLCSTVFKYANKSR